MAHVVLDPDEWVATCLRNHGEDNTRKFLTMKVERWRPVYESALASEGIAYKNRAVRDAIDAQLMDETKRLAEAAAAVEKAKADAAFEARIVAIVEARMAGTA